MFKLITVLLAIHTSASAATLRGAANLQQQEKQQQPQHRALTQIGLNVVGYMRRNVLSAGKDDKFLAPKVNVDIDAVDLGSRMLQTQAPTAADTPGQSMAGSDQTWSPTYPMHGDPFPFTDMPTSAPTSAPTPAPTPKACTVTNFVLWDAINNKPLEQDDLKLYDNKEICHSKLPKKVNIQAKVDDCVVKVRLELTGKSNRNQKEEKAPFMLAGDQSGKVMPMDLPVGKYVLSAIPDKNDALKKKISFSVTKC